MADGHHVETSKSPYLGNGLTNLHEICFGDAHCHS